MVPTDMIGEATDHREPVQNTIPGIWMIFSEICLGIFFTGASNIRTSERISDSKRKVEMTLPVRLRFLFGMQHWGVKR